MELFTKDGAVHQRWSCTPKMELYTKEESCTPKMELYTKDGAVSLVYSSIFAVHQRWSCRRRPRRASWYRTGGTRSTCLEPPGDDGKYEKKAGEEVEQRLVDDEHVDLLVATLAGAQQRQQDEPVRQRSDRSDPDDDFELARPPARRSIPKPRSISTDPIANVQLSKSSELAGRKPEKMPFLPV